MINWEYSSHNKDLTNQQGDVVRLVTATGATVAEYTYDAWGNPLTSSGAMATINPIRYRGYYYDTESGFYYLQSRYYDPVTCRFINADSAELSEMTAYNVGDSNMFAYCGNNPVSRDDKDGEFWNIVAGAAIGAAFSLGWQMIVEKKSFKEIDWIDVGASALNGGLAASGFGKAVQIVANAAIGGTQTALSGGSNQEIVLNSIMGGVSGWIGGKGANYKGAITDTVNMTKNKIARETRRVNVKYAKHAIKNAKAYARRYIGRIAAKATARYGIGSATARLVYRRYRYQNR